MARVEGFRPLKLSRFVIFRFLNFHRQIGEFLGPKNIHFGEFQGYKVLVLVEIISVPKNKSEQPIRRIVSLKIFTCFLHQI
jgi:hypothetical protein